MKLARHVVKPLSFVFPVFDGDPDGLCKLKLGLWVYDILCSFRNYRNHKGLSASDIQQWIPEIRQDGLQGGVQYYAAITDDSRITLEVILDAYHHDAVPLNYVRASRVVMDGGKVSGFQVENLLDGETIEVKSSFVVVAAGPWTSKVLGLADGLSPLTSKIKMRPTKGSHVVISKHRLPIDHAVVMLHPRDHRVMFALPWHNRTVLGTTDTGYKGDPGKVFASREDVDYLLTAANHYFPNAGLKPDDVISTWSGLRPLVDQEDAKNESEVSREHSIVVDPSGIGVIAGGKLTTFRVMGKQMVDAIAPFLSDKKVPRSNIKKIPLPYSHGAPESGEFETVAEHYAQDYGITPEQARHILNVYGGAAELVLESAKGDRVLLQPVIKGIPVLMCEVVYAVNYEMALHLEDFFMRRTPLFFLTREGLDLAFERVAGVMAQELDWDEETVSAEIQRMEELLKLHNRWRQE